MIKHPKRRGEWVELQFMTRATHHGLTVSKPWGDSSRYDFIVEHKGRCSRVQVKSTFHFVKGFFLCHSATHGGTRTYTSEQIDFFVAFVIPYDVFYIIPVTVMAGQKNVFLSPHRPENKYFRYMEAWHLLRKAPARKCL